MNKFKNISTNNKMLLLALSVILFEILIILVLIKTKGWI